MKRFIKIITFTGSLALGQPAAALSFECQLDGLSRTISVNYPEQAPVPCQVQYTKDDDTQVLWQASNTEGYCETKAQAFVAKHENWGWQCNRTPTNSQASQ